MENKRMINLKVFVVILLILWSIWNVVDLFSSAISGYDFLFGQVIVFSIYIFPTIIILSFFSLSLKKSEVKWQRILGNIGLGTVVVDILVNITAFIWNLIR
ncbi:MAG: hypothetical protein HYS02_01930 [Candidatus Staskawiczbacteria bacterium]|nr:hypothetical protein [Candidatus Staskawiczbacteria bacterium]